MRRSTRAPVGVVRLWEPRPNGRYDVSSGCGSTVVDPRRPSRPTSSHHRWRTVVGRRPPWSRSTPMGHNLAVVDAAGQPIRYLEGTGPTVGLAMCPGQARMVQLSSRLTTASTDDQPRRWSSGTPMTGAVRRRGGEPDAAWLAVFRGLRRCEAAVVRVWSDAPSGERYYVVDGRATLVPADASEPLVADDTTGIGLVAPTGVLALATPDVEAAAAPPLLLPDGRSVSVDELTTAVIEAGEMRMTIQNGSGVYVGGRRCRRHDDRRGDGSRARLRQTERTGDRRCCAHRAATRRDPGRPLCGRCRRSNRHRRGATTDDHSGAEHGRRRVGLDRTRARADRRGRRGH